MKLVFSNSTRDVVAKIAPGSTSEHVLSWNGSEPVLAVGYSVVDVDDALHLKDPAKYELDGRVTQTPLVKEDKVALLEAEIAAIKAKQAEQDAAIDGLKKP